LLLCACGGSLIDHSSPGLSSGSKCDNGTFKTSNGCQPATLLSAGASHTCAVAGGEAQCWGANDLGQLGAPGGSSFVPVQAAIAGAVARIAAGSSHSCAIADGDVWCWGDNTYGQLGGGTVGGSNATPQTVSN